MIKEIVTEPNSILRKKSRKIIDFKDYKTKKIIQDLKDTLIDCKEGLGLAAPQIGINLRVFALNIKNEILIFVNPEITHFSTKESPEKEGCLSVPGIAGKVDRANKVVMKYYDESGKKHKIKAKGIIAQAFQHEIDHLNGILYIDKMKQN